MNKFQKELHKLAGGGIDKEAIDMKHIKERLEYLRKQIINESMSYLELAELQSLAEYIEPGDVQLLEWAGVPEFPEDNEESK